jgi:hypothetical protein
MYSARPRTPDEPSRDEWCRNHRTGHHSSVFQPMESMRCTHTKRCNNGTLRTCSGYLGRAPHWCREAVVRCVLDSPPIPNAEHKRLTCGSCCKPVDVFSVRHAEMKAAG